MYIIISVSFAPLSLDVQNKKCYTVAVFQSVSSWRHRLVVRTPGFHPGNRGSIPLGATMKTAGLIAGGFWPAAYGS